MGNSCSVCEGRITHTHGKLAAFGTCAVKLFGYKPKVAHRAHAWNAVCHGFESYPRQLGVSCTCIYRCVYMYMYIVHPESP